MKLRPVHNHIIAKKHSNSPTSTGGILLTSTGEDESTHAEVLAIGVAYKGDIKIGDIVSYLDDKRVHSEKIDNEYILIMPEDCVLGVIENEIPAPPVPPTPPESRWVTDDDSLAKANRKNKKG